MRYVKYVAVFLVSIAIWTAVINFATFNGFLLSPMARHDTAASFVEATRSRTEDEFVGALALALVEDGEVVEDFYHSIGAPIDRHTIFQMASVSKWVTAWGIFALVDQGRLNLDQPVESYLTRWHLPESEYDHGRVTIRHLLSHTSGMVDGLGYAGFATMDSVQTLEASLTKAADGYWSEGVARIGYDPGTTYRYSGGGYTMLQLVIEEVSGRSFDDFMKEAIFKPLGMHRSSFHWSDTSSLDLVTFYDTDTTIAPHYRYNSRTWGWDFRFVYQMFLGEARDAAIAVVTASTRMKPKDI